MSDCIIFTGCRHNNGTGYGQQTVNQRRWLAHRYAWFKRNGPIPDGLFVCHRCNNKGCINVDHLYLATNAENVRDAWRDGISNNGNTVKKCCPRCQSSFSTNKYGRFCRPCKLASNRRTKARRQAIDAAMSAERKDDL